MTLKDITLKEICQRYNDSTVWSCYENKKYRMSKAETRRHLGGKQWAEVKWGDGQSINKDKNKSQALMKGTVAMLLICVTEIC